MIKTLDGIGKQVLESVNEVELDVNQLHGKIPIEVMYLPRPSNDYHGCYPKYFEKHLPRLVQSDDYYHFFGGKAETGFRIDIDLDNKLKPDLKADVQNLPMLTTQKKAVVADPPYNEDFAKNLYNCDYPKWSLWTKEAVRLCQVGGHIAIMQNYIVPRLPNCEYVKFVIILLRIKQYPKILTIQRRVS